MSWDFRLLRFIDMRVLAVILALMGISLVIISANDLPMGLDAGDAPFLTTMVKMQMKWFFIGSLVFLACAAMDYNKLREWTWLLYGIALLSLIGLFFVPSVQNVRRWYRIGGVGIQPSEHAKLIVVITLSWFLERRRTVSNDWSTVMLGGLIVGLPCLLILKQPDLGTALVLYPMTLVMFYFGQVRPIVIKLMSVCGLLALLVVLLFFSGIVSHEKLRPHATSVLKEYQYERLNPNTHHQKAALTAIAVGGLTGTGWRQSEFTGRGWLPAPYTDSVFPAFGEEFGFIGLLLMMVLFYSLIYFSFQVTAVAKDHFGRMLSAGITVYLAMHIVVSIGMMCGFLPITGVPLVLVTYGGSSVLSTMAALGILQSVYSRRFMF